MNDTVREWMTADVIVVPPTATLHEADTIMQERDIRRLAVVEGDALLGIVSHGDVRAALAAAAAEVPKPATLPDIGAIMTPHPITIPDSATVALAAKTMLATKVSGLPVVDDGGNLCGILSESDLFRYIVALSSAS